MNHNFQGLGLVECQCFKCGRSAFPPAHSLRDPASLFLDSDASNINNIDDNNNNTKCGECDFPPRGALGKMIALVATMRRNHAVYVSQPATASRGGDENKPESKPEEAGLNDGENQEASKYVWSVQLITLDYFYIYSCK